MKEKGKLRKEEIILKALELFSEQGYRETSLQEIADKLGVTRPAFYYYFDSKEEILWSIIERLGFQLLEGAKPIISEDGNPQQELRLILENHVTTLVQNSAAFKVYFNERDSVDKRRSRKLKKGEDEYVHLVALVIKRGQERGIFKQGDPVVISLILLGTCNSLVRWYSEKGPIKLAELKNIVVEILMHGVLAK